MDQEIQKLDNLTKEVNEIVAHVESMEVASPEDMEKAADVLKYIKTKINAIEENRKELVQPLNEHVKMINARFKAYTTPLSSAETIMKGKVSSYIEAERKKQKEEQARLEELRAAEIKKAEDEGKKDWEMPPPVVASKPDAGKAQGGFGAIHTRDYWTYEVEDISKVPFAFITVDDAVVREAIKEGRRDIPGLRIFNKPSVVSR